MSQMSKPPFFIVPNLLETFQEMLTVDVLPFEDKIDLTKVGSADHFYCTFEVLEREVVDHEGDEDYLMNVHLRPALYVVARMVNMSLEPVQFFRQVMQPQAVVDEHVEILSKDGICIKTAVTYVPPQEPCGDYGRDISPTKYRFDINILCHIKEEATIEQAETD